MDAVYEVDYGDAARTRNHGVERIDTKYSATLDGDDLFDLDWLWKGVHFLEELGDDKAVGHAAVRLTFGNELHGRIQISTDSHLFNPLNLIASWHYAADVIIPTDIYRKYPFRPSDLHNGLGAEDWYWTCESIREGIRHVIIPETAYFYRRQANHMSLGMAPGCTFHPTRLFDRNSIQALNRAYPSAAIFLADQICSITGPKERWAQVLDWLEQSVRRICDVDLAVYPLHSTLSSIPVETPDFFPAVGQLYMQLMDQLDDGHETVIMFCDHLTSDHLGLIECFLSTHKRERSLPLTLLVISLARDPNRDGRTSPLSRSMTRDHGDVSWLRLSYLDLGNSAFFSELWDHIRHGLIVRFLMQARAALVVNLGSELFDRIIGSFGKPIANSETKTVRVCRGDKADIGDKDTFASWQGLTLADGNYSLVLSRNAEVAEWLNAGFYGTGMAFRFCSEASGLNLDPAFGDALYALVSSGHEAHGLDEQGSTVATIMESPVLQCPASTPGNKPDVTCVLTVRAEGHYLNQTLQAVAAMCEDAHRHEIRTELIIVADCPGGRTGKVLSSLVHSWPEARVMETELDDEASARNAGISEASGRLVAVLAGADIISPGWLARAVLRAEDTGPDTILHPHAVVEYADGFKVTFQPDMLDSENSVEGLAAHEVWTVHALARKELFQRIPYRPAPARSGYGYSAWHWNCETAAAGCRHSTIAGTAVYRRPSEFMGEHRVRLGGFQPTIVAPTRFFTDHPWLHQSPSRGSVQKMRRTRIVSAVRKGLKSLAGKNDRLPAHIVPAAWDDHAYLLGNPDVQKAVANGCFRSGYDHYCRHGYLEGRLPHHAKSKLADQAPGAWNDATYLLANPDVQKAVANDCFRSGYDHYCRHGYLEGRIPHYDISHLVEEMRTLSLINPALKIGASDTVTVRSAGTSQFSDVYRSCRRILDSAPPTHVFLTPSLRPGGAELSMMHTIEAVVSSSGNRAMVITTFDNDERWRHRLPARCSWLPFASIAAGCSPEEQIGVLATLLINSGARCLHLFYSYPGWQMLRSHAPALADRMQVYVSIFSISPPSTTQANGGYAEFVGTLCPHLAGIFTDNERAATELETVCGIPRKKITVVKHPVLAEQRFPGHSRGEKLVLWASRLDDDKRPDLLMEIAGRLPSVSFHVFGDHVLGGKTHLRNLRRVPNITYRGTFCGFDTIAIAPYMCFLYTSVWDGMPNVVLEAMKSGLLVVAPDVGGISEVIGDDGGVLIRESDDPGAYADAIETVFRDPEFYRLVAENGRKRVTQAHTRAAFFEGLKKVPGYGVESDSMTD